MTSLVSRMATLQAPTIVSRLVRSTSSSIDLTTPGNETYGSLTLGGYDASRLTPNDVTFTLSSVDTHDLVVGVQSISYSDSKTDEIPLLAYGDGRLALIDSTLPNIWLPVPACDAFAEAFGLTFDSLNLIYIINNTMHDANLKNNASVTFQLGNFVTGGATVNITLPYASFDLNLTTNYPNILNTTAYFPLRQAQDSTQYTLGRAFLQEAYVDYPSHHVRIWSRD